MYHSKHGMATKSQKEDDLEQICGMFKNLKVGRVKRKSNRSGNNRHKLKTEFNGEIVLPNKDGSLHKTKKLERKSVLKESSLKLPPNLAYVVNKQKFTEKGTSEVNNECCRLKNSSQIAGGTKMSRTCSMEFRNSSMSSVTEFSSICTRDEFCDNESDELADYFEEVLFLPRPMSAMAEMMYG